MKLVKLNSILGYLKQWGANAKVLSLGVGVLAALIYLNPNNPGYIGVNPHPYFIVAIVLAVLLGSRFAILLSLLLTSVYVSCLNSAVNAQEAESLYTLSNYAFCFTLIAVPIFVGVFMDRYRLNQENLEKYIREQSEVTRELERENRNISKTKSLIEGRLASHGKSLDRILSFAQILEAGEVGEISGALVDFVCEQIGEDNCYLYLFREKDLRCVARRDEAAFPFPSTISFSEIALLPLVKKAIETKKMSRIEEFPVSTDSAASIKDHALVIPLVTFSDQTVGLMMIRKARFLNYVPSTFANLNATARWGAMCISRALRLQSRSLNIYRDETTGLFSFQYFRRRIDAEWRRARRIGLPLHTVRFQISEMATLSPLQRIAFLKLCSKAFETVARTVDTVTIGEKAGHFYTIMMISSLQEVEAYIGKARTEFNVICAKIAPAAGLSLQVNRYSVTKDQQSSIEYLAMEEAA